MSDYRIIAHWAITSYVHWDGHKVTEPLVRVTPDIAERLPAWRWN